MKEQSCMTNKELFSQARTGWTWRFSPWDPKLASVTLPCDPVVSILLQSCLFVPFFLQLEVGGMRGMTKPYAIRFFSLFLLYLTSVTLCPGLPLQVAAQVAQFLGTRHSYSAGNLEGHSGNVWKAGFILHEMIIYIHKYAVHIYHLHLQDSSVLYLIDSVQNWYIFAF